METSITRRLSLRSKQVRGDLSENVFTFWVVAVWITLPENWTR